MNKSLRFSGHDTFHCKEQWILKGLQLIEKQSGISIFRETKAIPECREKYGEGNLTLVKSF